MEQVHDYIEAQIEALDPAVEVLAVQRSGPEKLQIFIDHPEGVDLGLCERVSNALVSLSSEWALEVSSPGLDRPLAKPEHYRRFVGSRVRVRMREAVEGRKNFTGRLVAADESSVSVEDEAGRHQIPLDRVHRSNVVPEFSEVSP